MNRGVHISRELPERDDLEYTAYRIIKGYNNNKECKDLPVYIEKIVKIFIECMKQFE